MRKIPLLYKKPYLLALTAAILGLAAFLYGLYRSGELGDMGGYAFSFVGFFLFITGLVIGAVFLNLERKFRLALGQPLLAYTADPAQYDQAIEKTINQIKAANTVSWLTILVFCVLLALLGPLFVEDGLVMTAIAAVIAAVMTVLFWLITRYRVHKLLSGSRQVIRAVHGVYVAGEFHAWSGFSSKLIDIRYFEPGENGRLSGMISGSYRVIGAYRSNDGFFNLAVPPELDSQARAAVDAVKASGAGNPRR